MKIRENAPIELPHIMLLIDDPEKTVIERLFEKVESFEKLYDFELMQCGGHIRGWKVEDSESLKMIASALSKLADPAVFAQKYGLKRGVSPASSQTEELSPMSVLLFAAGDGNHSLASAKAHWENIKASLAPGILPDHPARYALVEVVNVHDEGLVFEPIHRVLFGINSTTMLENINSICSREINTEYRTEYKLYDSKASMDSAIRSMSSSKNYKSPHMLPFILEGAYGLIIAHNSSCSLEVGTLQSFIDELIKNDANVEVDYIHGDHVVTELGSKKGCMGFYLPVMDKNDLFRTVLLEGVLPRKTFSMGEAEEKRYYLECRKIK